MSRSFKCGKYILLSKGLGLDVLKGRGIINKCPTTQEKLVGVECVYYIFRIGVVIALAIH
jgi:hypothetical protein